MQPTLQKVHSVDCEQRRRPTGARGPSGGPLVHSVSIVVELAKEQPACRAADFGEEAGKLARQVDSVDSTADELETGEAASDEEEDDGGCLCSELARKVVIVDEAEKILMSRARSAEPNFASGSQESERSSSALGDNLATAGGEDARPNISGPLDSAGALTASACLVSRPSGKWMATCSSGELAERGELSQLSRRRNTHHHVSGLAHHLPQAPTGRNQTASAQLERRPGPGGRGACVAPSQPVGHLCQHHRFGQQPNVAAANWSHRRQSLQMSLFTGSRRSDSPSKSLTEEELRGEREFNEQVRSARPPEVIVALGCATPTTTAAAAASPADTTSLAQLRRRSVTGDSDNISGTVGGSSPDASSSSSSTTTTDTKETAGLAFEHVQAATGPSGATDNRAANRKGSYQIPHSIVKTQHKQSQRPRRVSFSSIDPIANCEDHHQQQQQQHQCQQDPAAHHRQHLQRVCLQQPSPDFKLCARQRLSSGSILENIANQSSSRAAESTDQQQQQQHLHETSRKPPAGHKRHSLAEPTAAACDRPNNWRPAASPARGVRNNPFWLRDRSDQLASGKGSPITPTRSGASKMNPTEHEKMSEQNETSRLVGGHEDADTEQPEAAAEPQMETFSATLQDRDEAKEQISSTIIEERVRDAPNTQQKDGGRVQSIMANAKLRQEEFARLLAEHEQIVNEINRVETKISNSQTANAIRQQQTNDQQ